MTRTNNGLLSKWVVFGGFLQGKGYGSNDHKHNGGLVHLIQTNKLLDSIETFLAD